MDECLPEDVVVWLAERDVKTVDFFVDLESRRTLSDLGGLVMDLQEELGTPVDIVTERGLRVRVRERVLAEAVSL